MTKRAAPRVSAKAKAHAAAVADGLARAYPDVGCALDFEDPLQCLVSTILSAQCTDARVNTVTPELFRRYPDARAFARARRDTLEKIIHPLGFFRNKAANIMACCRRLADDHGGRVPDTLEELVALPGVGRKTANCVLVNAYGKPGVMVDTHCIRVARRLGLHRETDPEKIEAVLKRLLPEDAWSAFSHRVIVHGRRVCHARKPRCEACPLAPRCPRIGV